jgi:DNA polymerase-3 subunit delta
MLMRPDAFETALKKPHDPLPPLIWIATDEDLLRLEACDQVRLAARARDHQERVVFQVDRHFKLDPVWQQAHACSLFTARQLIELRLTGKPTKEFAESLADASPNIPETVCMVVASPRLDRAATESTWYKKLLQHAWMVAIPTVDRTRLPAWIGERLRRHNQEADAETLQWMAQRVEGNLLAADQEVRKLALLLPPGRISGAAVHAAVLDVARWNVFDLIDATLAGQAPRALRCLSGLRAEGTAAPMILWALTDTIRTLIKLGHSQAQGRPLHQALRDARIWGERERLYPQALRRLARPHLHALLRECALADRLAKGLERGDLDTLIDRIALSLAGAPVLQAAARL